MHSMEVGVMVEDIEVGVLAENDMKVLQHSMQTNHTPMILANFIRAPYGCEE